MKPVIRNLSIVILSLFLAAPSAVFGQTYCPQALMGQMNGSWYYNSQVCAITGGCSMMHIATDSSHDCGGCCGGCCGGGTPNCVDAIDGTLGKGPTPARATATAQAADGGDGTFDVLLIGKQTEFADFNKAGFKGPGRLVTITRYKVQVDIPGKGTRYFYCIEAVHADYPNQPLRVGQEIDGDIPIPGTLAVTLQTMQRTKGAGHYHRLKLSNTVHFDVTSVNDLGNQ